MRKMMDAAAYSYAFGGRTCSGCEAKQCQEGEWLINRLFLLLSFFLRRRTV